MPTSDQIEQLLRAFASHWFFRCTEGQATVNALAGKTEDF